MPLGLGNIDLKICDQSYNVEIQFRFAVLSFVFLGLVEEVLSQICWVVTTSKRARTGKDHHFLLPLGDLWPSPFWFPNRRHVLPDGARLHTQNAERVDTFEWKSESRMVPPRTFRVLHFCQLSTSPEIYCYKYELEWFSWLSNCASGTFYFCRGFDSSLTVAFMNLTVHWLIDIIPRHFHEIKLRVPWLLVG